MEQLLALRLADLTRPMNVGIFGPSDTDLLVKAAWRSGNVKLSYEEVRSLCCVQSVNISGCHG